MMATLSWKTTFLSLAGFLLTSAGCRVESAPGNLLRFEPYELVTSGGERVPGELAYLSVPENRTRPDSRTIELAVLRLRVTSAQGGDPIVFLAGGPGSSAIDAVRGARFPAFLALRQSGDVIALEQRGTGRSRPALGCPERRGYPLDQAVTPEAAIQSLRGAAERCAAALRSQGADLGGYNAIEIADDLEALRLALGVRKLVLWGSSHGTQLALATMRRYPDLASRAILAGVRGPDDTWPLPSLIDRRLASVPPGLTARLVALADRLDTAPAVIRVPRPSSSDSLSIAFGGYDLLGVVTGYLDDPGQQSRVPSLIAAGEQGDWSAIGPDLLRDRQPRSIGSPMGYATACASGISAARRARMEQEAQHSILARHRNVAEASCEVWGARDLGEEFRQPVRSDVPTLLISGSLDLTTPVDDAEAVLRGLSRGVHVILNGARHGADLVTWPGVTQLMLDFLHGRPIQGGVLAPAQTPKP